MEEMNGAGSRRKPSAEFPVVLFSWNQECYSLGIDVWQQHGVLPTRKPWCLVPSVGLHHVGTAACPHGRPQFPPHKRSSFAWPKAPTLHYVVGVVQSPHCISCTSYCYYLAGPSPHSKSHSYYLSRPRLPREQRHSYHTWHSKTQILSSRSQGQSPNLSLSGK